MVIFVVSFGKSQLQVTQRYVWNINNVVEIYHFYEKRPLKISSGLLLYQSYAKAKPRFFVTRVYTRHRRVWVITFTFGQLLLVFQLLCSVWILWLHGPGFRHSVVNRPMTCSCRIKFFFKISTLQGRINLRFNNRDHHGGLHKAVLNGKEADVEQLLSSGKGNWKNCSRSYCLSGWAIGLIARDRFVKVMSQLWMKKDLVKVGDEVKQSHWTAGREVDVAVMWSSTKHLTFNVPISTEELKKVPANCTGNLTKFYNPIQGRRVGEAILLPAEWCTWLRGRLLSWLNLAKGRDTLCL